MQVRALRFTTLPHIYKRRLMWLRHFWKKKCQNNEEMCWHQEKALRVLGGRHDNVNPNSSRCFGRCTRDWFGIWSHIPHSQEVRKSCYKLQFSANLKIHQVFHPSCLKPYHEDKEDLTRGILHWAPAIMTTSFDKDVELVFDSRTVCQARSTTFEEYHVKW